MARFPQCAFWDFSVAAYGRPGVAAACLALQERYAADVNLLLFACWLGATGRGTLDKAVLRRAEAAIEAWHIEVVRVLREVRQRLKRDRYPASAGLAAPFRRRIQAAELEAEHIEQLALAEIAPKALLALAPTEILVRRAAEGVLGYLASLGDKPDAKARTNVAIILAGAFPDASKERIAAILKMAG
jgi:uncharacterized protein (TIGR02444 family)